MYVCMDFYENNEIKRRFFQIVLLQLSFKCSVFSDLIPAQYVYLMRLRNRCCIFYHQLVHAVPYLTPTPTAPLLITVPPLLLFSSQYLDKTLKISITSFAPMIFHYPFILSSFHVFSTLEEPTGRITIQRPSCGPRNKFSHVTM